MAERNVTLNRHLFAEGSSVCVRSLDWQQSEPLSPIAGITTEHPGVEMLS